jgi:hypothetical protein
MIRCVWCSRLADLVTTHDFVQTCAAQVRARTCNRQLLVLDGHVCHVAPHGRAFERIHHPEGLIQPPHSQQVVEVQQRTPRGLVSISETTEAPQQCSHDDTPAAAAAAAAEVMSCAGAACSRALQEQQVWC